MFKVNNKNISDVVRVFLLLTLNIICNFFSVCTATLNKQMLARYANIVNFH